MNTQVETVRVIQPGEGRALWVLTNHQTHKLTGDDTNGALFIWEERVPPEGGPPPHSHKAEDEIFYVLAGSLTFFTEAGPMEVGTGGLVHVPRGAVHTFKNTSTEEARMLVMTTPAGCERYFNAIGMPATDATAAPEITPEVIERALEAAPRHNLEFHLPA